LVAAQFRFRARVQLQRLRLRDYLLDRVHLDGVFDLDRDELAEGILKAKTFQVFAEHPGAKRRGNTRKVFLFVGDYA